MTQTIVAAHRSSTLAAERTNKHDVALGYLRAFIIVLVVMHHAVLAYHPFAPPPHASLVISPHWWGAFPVVDPRRSNLFALLVGFDDNFFMSLMFFLSGLFVWNSLRRKNIGLFLRDRLLRLGIPFVVAAVMLAPLAYYPAFLQTNSPGGFPAFCHQWLSLGDWPVGPAWFLWVLFVFDCIAAAIFQLAPRALQALGRFAAALSVRPIRIFVLISPLPASPTFRWRPSSTRCNGAPSDPLPFKPRASCITLSIF